MQVWSGRRNEVLWLVCLNYPRSEIVTVWTMNDVTQESLRNRVLFTAYQLTRIAPPDHAVHNKSSKLPGDTVDARRVLTWMTRRLVISETVTQTNEAELNRSVISTHNAPTLADAGALSARTAARLFRHHQTDALKTALSISKSVYTWLAFTDLLFMPFLNRRVLGTRII